MAKVFITKYALTKGIIEVEAELHKSSYNGELFIMNDYCSHYIGKDAFLDKSEALKKAEEMRNKKVDSLKKQIGKLEKITF